MCVQKAACKNRQQETVHRLSTLSIMLIITNFTLTLVRTEFKYYAYNIIIIYDI